MKIADNFVSIRAKYTGTHGTGGGVALLVAEKEKQAQPVTIPSTPATPGTPPDEYWQEMYEERAAIMEFDGGVARAEAERLAKEQVDALRGVSRVAGVSAKTERPLS